MSSTDDTKEQELQAALAWVELPDFDYDAPPSAYDAYDAEHGKILPRSPHAGEDAARILAQAVRELQQQNAELKAWKESALLVERSWDAQAVAKLLNVPLGLDIRSEIQPRIERLLAELAAAQSEEGGS